MTLEQLISPKVTEWIDNYNKRINEGHRCDSTEYLKEFDEWFGTHEDEINESVRSSKVLNEGAFSELFDDEEDEETPEKVDTDEEIPEEMPTKEAEEEIEAEVEESEALKSKFRVTNSMKDPNKNVFNVVNTLYEKICKDKKNLDKVTYLSLIDTSIVHDMTALLAFTNIPNADLSGWDTGKVITMEGMFYKSTFDNDSIADWNVGSCKDFKNMFLGSKFSQSVSKWKPALYVKKEKVTDPETGEGRWEEVERRYPLPFVGAYDDEEREMRAAYWDERIGDAKLESKFPGKHILDFETFLINEGLLDKVKGGIKKGVKKVKDFFKMVALKLNDFFIGFIGEDGKLIEAVSPYTTLNYIGSGKVKGVKAYTHVKNELINDSVGDIAETMESDEYYQYSDYEDPNVVANYKYFLENFNKLAESNNVTILGNEKINEDRVGFSAESGGIKNIGDIDSEQLKEVINYVMECTPANVGELAATPIFIWGAPGIGKSSIPNAIIKAYNKGKDALHRKALIVAECGNMTSDGFALPMPARMTATDYISNRPIAQKIAKELGLSDDDLKNELIQRSDDYPKLWLPCYKPSPDERITQLRMQIANGHIDDYYDDENKYHVDETCDGGLILFDEFFRADQQIFKILMQILNTRRYGDYILGDKWGLIVCSNRPGDDDEVNKSYSTSAAALTTRMTQFNYIPSFVEWKKWAKTKGHFDDLTLEFLVQDEDSNGEYINWHNIDTKLHREGVVTHPTPRTWSNYMKILYNYMKNHKIDSVKDIPEKVLSLWGNSSIGKDVTEKYISFIKDNADKVLDIKKVFNDSKYEIPKGEKPKAAELTEDILKYIESNYTSKDLPEESELINMFNFLDKTYSRSKDNYVKQMHINILKYLVKDREAAKRLKGYYKLCVERYEIMDEDIS